MINRPTIRVDMRNFVRVDGVCIGRLIPERRAIEVIDKDRRRSAARGERTVEVPVDELVKLFAPRPLRSVRNGSTG